MNIVKYGYALYLWYVFLSYLEYIIRSDMDIPFGSFIFLGKLNPDFLEATLIYMGINST